MLSVIILSVIMLSVIMLSVIMLSVIMPSVEEPRLAPGQGLTIYLLGQTSPYVMQA